VDNFIKKLSTAKSEPIKGSLFALILAFDLSKKKLYNIIGVEQAD